MKTTKSVLASVSVIGLLAAPVTAFSDDTIKWARDGDIDSLDPHRATSTLSRMTWLQIYDTLLEFDDDGNVVPNLAHDWSVNDDGRRVTFELHDGIVCHDGNPFTAEDVQFTAERALGERDKDRSITASSWGPIERVEVVDELTVAFHLEEPFAAFVPFMADEFASMICKSMEGDEDFGRRVAVGTGPWALVEWDRGNRILLQAHDQFVNHGMPTDNDGPPLMDYLDIRVMPEGQSRYSALQTGQVDMIVPPIDDVPTIDASPDYDLHIARPTGQNMFIEFATSRPPFDDVRGRQAIAHALDFDAAIEIVFGDLVDREHCPISSGVLGNDPEFCQAHSPQHDPERARELLDELGYGPGNPAEIVMMTWHGDNRDRMLQVFQSQLAQVGVQAEIEVMDIGTLNARVTTENRREEGRGTLDLMGWTWFDPDLLHLLWHSPGAYEGYTHPDLDELLARTRTTLDEDERVEVVQQVFAHLLENAVHVPVYSPGWLWMYAVNADLKGFKVSAFDRPIFNGVHR